MTAKSLRLSQYILLLMFLGVSYGSIAQNTRSCMLTDKGYWKSYFSDTKDVLLSPLRWKPKQWMAAGLVVGGATLLFNYDSDIATFFRKRQSGWGDKISRYGLEPWGGGVYSVSVFALFYGQGLIWNNRRSQKVALLGVKAYVFASLAVQVPKFLLNRHRPSRDNPLKDGVLEGPSTNLYKSFPSGHTTIAFAIATVLASEYSNTVWVPVLSYTMASLSGISRIYDYEHWASDVFFGAALGYAIGKFVYKSSNWNLSVYPSINRDATSLSINYTF